MLGGLNWTTTSSYNNWLSVASSSSGNVLAAVVNGGGIYTSFEFAPSSQPSSSPSSSPTQNAIHESPFGKAGWAKRVIKIKIQYFLLSYLIYFITMYVLFYVAGLESVSKRLSKNGIILLKSSYQSGMYLPVSTFEIRESLADYSNIHLSAPQPAYIKMIRYLHYGTIRLNEEKKLNVLCQDNPLSSQYPIEFYVFISQNWTNLGCEGLLYPNGFHIPVINKTLPIGIIENMYLYTINHHDFLRPFLCASSPYVTRGDHRNLFITTYSVAFFVSTFLDILLRNYISNAWVSLILFTIATGIAYVSKKVAIIIIGYVIDMQRFYRLKLIDGNLNNDIPLMGYALSIVVVFISIVFCSALLVFACFFSVSNGYSRTSIIVHNALQVHLSIAIQKAVSIMLLYVDHFHINVSFNNHHFITIGAFFVNL